MLEVLALPLNGADLLPPSSAAVCVNSVVVAGKKNKKFCLLLSFF